MFTQVQRRYAHKFNAGLTRSATLIQHKESSMPGQQEVQPYRAGKFNDGFCRKFNYTQQESSMLGKKEVPAGKFNATKKEVQPYPAGNFNPT